MIFSHINEIVSNFQRNQTLWLGSVMKHSEICQQSNARLASCNIEVIIHLNSTENSYVMKIQVRHARVFFVAAPG